MKSALLFFILVSGLSCKSSACDEQLKKHPQLKSLNSLKKLSKVDSHNSDIERLRLVAYIDGNCPSCYSYMTDLIKYAKTYFPKVQVTFILHSQDSVMMNYNLSKQSLDADILIDKESQFQRENYDLIYNGAVFISTTDYKPILFGNPLQDEDLTQEFQQILECKKTQIGEPYKN